jgi:hypothetical protein
MWLRICVLRRKLVHLVLHIGEVGQLVVEMAIEQLDPQHQLPLLVSSYEVVEELQAGYEQLLVCKLLVKTLIGQVYTHKH